MSAGASSEASTEVTVDLHGQALEPGAGPGPTRRRDLTVALSWTPAESAIVTARFPHQPDTSWVLGRELLAAGCLAPSGVGDVALLPDPFDPATAELVLSNGHTRICIAVRVAALAEFLDRTDMREEVSVMCKNGCYMVKQDGRWTCVKCGA